MTHPSHGERSPCTPEQVDQLVFDAVSATRVLPTIARCHCLDQELRVIIEQLAAHVQRKRSGLMRGSLEWYRCDRLLVDANAILASAMGSGLMTAALHVAALGRHAEALAGECRRAEL